MRIIETFSLVMITTLCFSSSIWASEKVANQTQLHAFGGTIPVPSNMDIDVKEKEGFGIQIGMLNRMWSGVGILAINLTRPSNRKSTKGEEIQLLESYSLNGFEVDLYQMDQSTWSSDLYSAQIGRCGEWGQIVAKTKSDIDRYLLTIDKIECDR